MRKITFLLWIVIAPFMLTSCYSCYICTHTDTQRDDKIVGNNAAGNRVMGKKAVKATVKQMQILNYNCMEVK